MRILVRLELNWKFLEIISRRCATLSAIGCIRVCLTASDVTHYMCIARYFKWIGKTRSQDCLSLPVLKKENLEYQAGTKAAHKSRFSWIHLEFTVFVTGRAHFSRHETRNDHWNGDWNPEWSPQVSFQTAHLTRNLYFNHLGYWFSSRWPFRVSRQLGNGLYMCVTCLVICWSWLVHTCEMMRTPEALYMVAKMHMGWLRVVGSLKL